MSMGSAPLPLVADFLRSCGNVLQVEISTYRYTPETIRDDRRLYRIALDELETAYAFLSSQLSGEENIAFHSRVLIKEHGDLVVRHLPMADLSGHGLAEIRSAFDQISAEASWRRAALFASGRSFHFYGFVLLDLEAWIKFMGRLLLLNRRGEREVVDSRWVGHRLMAGYGSLRWSWRGAQYTSAPQLVHMW